MSRTLKSYVVAVIAVGLVVLSLFVSACGTVMQLPKQADVGVSVTDSIGRRLELPHTVKRAAVSNAYNAELIIAIGAAEAIVGVDSYIYRDKEGFGYRFTENQLIGKNQRELNYEKIIELKPDVLILTDNGGWKEAEEKLRPFDIPVIVVNAYYTNEFESNVALLGTVFGREAQAAEFSDYFMSKVSYIRAQLRDIPQRSVYFEYRSPGRTTIPGDYFYPMLEIAHADNVFKDAASHTIDVEAVPQANPSYIVKVSDVGVDSSLVPPTEEDAERIYEGIVTRPGWDEIEAVKNNRILLMSHYVHGGASKLIGAMYIAKFLYPEYLPDLHPEEIFEAWTTRYEGISYHERHTKPAVH